jgi:hypothetical protein
MIINCGISEKNTPYIKLERQNKIYARWNYLQHNIDFSRFSNEIVFDLLLISIYVFGADKQIERNRFMNGWSRDFHLIIPVSNIAVFNKNKSILKNMLSFVSGDKWEFTFVKRKKFLIRESTVEYRKTNGYVALLSGGLDSFIGSINMLESNLKKTVFLSWYGGGKTTKPTQDKVIDLLKKQYGLSDDNFSNFYLSFSGKETTTRTRSFFLFMHAVATCFNYETNNEIIVPENGFISLNVPLTEARSGSSSTKTTHPYYLNEFNTLLKNFGIYVTLINPYQYKSKGEMIDECKNTKFLQKHMHSTVSCSHPDTRGTGEQGQCGLCWPCIVRRASIKSSKLYDYTQYNNQSRYDIDKFIKPYKLFLLANENNKEFKVLNSGPLEIENISKYVSVFKKGYNEIEQMVNIIEKNNIEKNI